MVESSPKARKPYERPTVTNLRLNKQDSSCSAVPARASQGAKDLLELMFPDAPSKDSKAKKNSA